MKRILLISAHPDDMEIGMGGTAAKLAAEGHSLLSVVVTDGRRAPNPTAMSQDDMAAARRIESKNACRALGIGEERNFGFESVGTDEACRAATDKMAALIAEFGPDEIYTLHPELDRHASHRAAGKICIDACRQLDRETPVWAYEVWGLFPSWDRFEDITGQLDKKLAAIAEHKSQIAAVAYDEGVRGLNRWRAVFADPHQEETLARYAEVFMRLN